MTTFFRYSLVLLAVCLTPASAFAASLSFETPPGPASVGDTVVVRAYLDSGTDSLNALDGDLTLTAPLHFTIAEVNLANAALTIWAKKPVVSADGTHITFTGGAPGGLPSTHALLMNILLIPDAPGTLSFGATTAVAYKNDGKGTTVPVQVQPFSLVVTMPAPGATPRNQWKEFVGVDTTPPAPFTITLGHDASLFEGKTFITFQTTDSQSGIDRYEVKEGDAAPVRSDTNYVLTEQTAPVTVTVYAYDKAGNVQSSTLRTGTTGTSYLPWMVLALLVVVGLLALFLLRKKKI